MLEKHLVESGSFGSNLNKVQLYENCTKALEFRDTSACRQAEEKISVRDRKIKLKNLRFRRAWNRSFESRFLIVRTSNSEVPKTTTCGPQVIKRIFKSTQTEKSIKPTNALKTESFNRSVKRPRTPCEPWEDRGYRRIEVRNWNSDKQPLATSFGQLTRHYLHFGGL